MSGDAEKVVYGYICGTIVICCIRMFYIFLKRPSVNPKCCSDSTGRKTRQGNWK